LDGNGDDFFDKYIDSEVGDRFWIAEPRNLNLRLRQQGGTFLIADNLNKTIMKLIEEDKKYDVEIHKLIFPHSIIVDIYAGLKKCT